MSEEPFNLLQRVTDYKISLGKAILNPGHDILHGPNLPDWVIDRASDHKNIIAADKWRAHHQTQLTGLADMIKRTLPCLPGDVDAALTSLLSDYASNTYGAWEFLMSATPRYVRDTVMMANKAEPEEFKQNLEVIVAFCEGK